MANMYTSNVGYSADVNAAIGKFDRPIRMIIEEESNLCRAQGQYDRLIYNVASSDSFAEAYFLENELGILSAVDEGGGRVRLEKESIRRAVFFRCRDLFPKFPSFFVYDFRF